VHRAGYDKEGTPVTVSVESIKELVNNCRTVAEKIDAHVQELEN
jgi:GTPase